MARGGNTEALRRRPPLFMIILIVAVVAAAWVGHAVGVSLGHPGDSEVAGLTPTPPGVTTGATLPPDLNDVARAALSRTVTVEGITSTDEQLGTAWAFDDHGDYVTNNHVVAGAVSLRIRDRSGNTHVVAVVGTDTTQDIALLRTADGFGAASLPVATTAVRIADPVVAIASSRATGHADVTTESVIRLGVDVTVANNPDVDPSGTAEPLDYHGMIAVHGATIYAGNSGGPLLNDAGEVVGIITLSSRSQPEAYAIPLDHVIDELRAFAAKP